MKNLHKNLIRLFCVSLLFLLSQKAAAQVPQQLNYQGAVRNSKGEPIVNQPITVRLSILDNGPNSQAVYSEIRLLNTNSVGLYSAAIGNPAGLQSSSGNFSQINWGTGAKYLKVEVDLEAGSDFTLAGTTPLLSVPYSLYAKYAENGPIGPQGPAGTNGLSAYEIWEGLPGNDGKTIQEFLAGLVGPAGANGLSAYEIWEGLPGNDGKTVQEFLAGLVGPAGANGLSAYEIWEGLPGNDGKTLEEFLAGLVGPAGANGLSAYEIWEGLPGNDGKTLEEFLAGLVGPQGPQGPAGPAGGGPSTLTNTHILVGDVNNTPQDVAMSGDANISNTGVLTIADDAVTLPKMGTAGLPDANKIYITNNNGDPELFDKNLFSWNVNGNAGTNASHFIGTTDQQNLLFRVNNVHAGRLSVFDLTTSYGTNAGLNIATGNVNLFLGFSAGRNITNAVQTTIVGSQAGRNMTNSIGNTFIGAGAGINSDFAERNTYIGASSGQVNSGTDNLFLGYNSGNSGTNLISNSVFIGSETKANLPIGSTLVNAIAIGYKAEVDADNSMVLGGLGANAVKVGIGTSLPTQKLHIKDGHIRSEQTVMPTVLLNTANGFNGVTLSAGATDVRGVISFGGTTLDSETYSVMQFDLNMPATNSPVVTITPANLEAAQSDYFVQQTAGGFLLHVKGKTTPIIDPKYNYIIIE